MPTSDSMQPLFEQLGISVLLGIVVGLQRERSESAIAGLRTFPLITVLGTLAASMDALVSVRRLDRGCRRFGGRGRGRGNQFAAIAT